MGRFCCGNLPKQPPPGLEGDQARSLTLTLSVRPLGRLSALRQERSEAESARSQAPAHREAACVLGRTHFQLHRDSRDGTLSPLPPPLSCGGKSCNLMTFPLFGALPGVACRGSDGAHFDRHQQQSKPAFIEGGSRRVSAAFVQQRTCSLTSNIKWARKRSLAQPLFSAAPSKERRDC